MLNLFLVLLLQKYTYSRTSARQLYGFNSSQKCCFARCHLFVKRRLCSDEFVVHFHCSWQNVGNHVCK